MELHRHSSRPPIMLKSRRSIDSTQNATSNAPAGSQPQYCDPTNRFPAAVEQQQQRRRPAAPPPLEDHDRLKMAGKNDDDDVAESPHSKPSRGNGTATGGQFTRSGRRTMQFLGADATSGSKWIDAAERAAQSYHGTKSLPRNDGATRNEDNDDEWLLVRCVPGASLGLAAVPDPANGGLLVQQVTVGGAAEAGRLRAGDRILEINGVRLVGPQQGEQTVQSLLRQGGTLRLHVARAKTAAAAKSSSGHFALQQAANNTRKIGHIHEIALRKGPHGLGFSLTTRDNPAGGQSPIYVKKILPLGAAILDGRLRAGDRLLEVNGVPIAGQSQAEVVEMLRATPANASVTFVVSRQQEGAPHTSENDIAVQEPSSAVGQHAAVSESANVTPPKPPAPIFPTPKPTSTSDADAQPQRECLTLHIPVKETEKAGLGISVKGKTSTNRSASSELADGDLGIFVKSVLNGGAASLDGRLRMNDQLLWVNESSLLAQSNEEAMETLRNAMLRRSCTHPGMITLKVARRVGSRPTNGQPNGGRTVVYLSPEKGALDRNPVLDRLTGGMAAASIGKPPSTTKHQHALRNESYYKATNATQPHINTSVLIEDDPEPRNPNTNRSDPAAARPAANSNGSDITTTYDSQLSLDTKPEAAAAFSRDAIGRRSMSEKHHAALDAKETGTYQRNKMAREQRERSANERPPHRGGSMESLRVPAAGQRDGVPAERMVQMGALDKRGPSLGLKISSSLESLQTLVQEIQMADGEPKKRGAMSLRAPRGGRRGEDTLPATDTVDGGFITRHGPLHSSLHEGKAKTKKSTGLLKGIGQMFRLGRYRRDNVVAPAVPKAHSDFGPTQQRQQRPSAMPTPSFVPLAAHRPPGGPPIYQQPPAPPPPLSAYGLGTNTTFNQRYAQSFYVHPGELQQQQQMGRRNQHYYSQRSIHSPRMNHPHFAGPPALQLPHATLAQLHAHRQQLHIQQQQQYQQQQQQQQRHYLHQSQAPQPQTAGYFTVGRPYRYREPQQSYHPQQHRHQHLHRPHHQRPVSSYNNGDYETFRMYRGASGIRKTSVPSSSLHQYQQQEL